MFKKIVLIISSVCIFNSSYSQAKIEDDFNFVSQKIKNEYVGFLDKTNQKYFNAYQTKVKASRTKDEFQRLSLLCIFFKDLHLKLYDLNISKNIDTQICKLNYESILNKLNNQSDVNDKVEGYWLSDYHNCVIGIKKTKKIPLTYEAYIVENKKKAPLGFKIFTMIKNNGREDFNTDFYDENLGFRTFLNSKFKNQTTLFLNSFGKYTKLLKYESGLLSKFTDFSFDFKLAEIKKDFLLLTMPDFGYKNIKVIDSIIKNNEGLISQANTLIIDIRNNMGGTVKNYLPLFRFFCINNIERSSFFVLRKSKVKETENEILDLEKSNDSTSLNENKIYLSSLKKSSDVFLFTNGVQFFALQAYKKLKL